MGLRDWFRRKPDAPDTGFGVEELARRLSLSADELRAVQPAYHEFTIPKRSGGTRRICAPAPPLKALQRRICRRLLRRLRAHPCATGFERGHSIVTHAAFHARQAIVIRMDLKEFFDSTRADRVRDYFRKIGWNREAADLLVRLCTHRDGLPQGAPTSPRLSNLVNYRLDARLAAAAAKFGAAYSRYADDLTFSLGANEPRRVSELIRITKHVTGDHGYVLHQRKKLQIRRQHQRQLVTGLVVNDRVNLPRSTRRRLRAIEHHLAHDRPATLTPAQFAGWQALQFMIVQQAPPLPETDPAGRT
jgi:RNA-directed DNA polymerase